jgi:subtilisin-like proprotein convertase family protein
MNSFSLLSITSLMAIVLCSPWQTNAATTVLNYTVAAAVPDGSILGWSDTRTVVTSHTLIESVTVHLNVSGGFNGDLYAQLTHSTGFAVLLNRVGRKSSALLGYSDSGMNVQFNDSAANGDIHSYRATLFGNETTPLVGPLTGTWRPDGRAVDPGLVLDTDLRTAFLSSFIGLNPNGDWTLFVADLEGGDVSTVTGWGLTLVVVPEPGIGGLLLFSGVIWFGCRRTRRRGFNANVRSPVDL